MHLAAVLAAVAAAVTAAVGLAALAAGEVLVLIAVATSGRVVHFYILD